MVSFTTLCNAWKAWAENADKSDQGWESDYPKWMDLINEAISVMVKPVLAEHELSNIEMCWNISEESEILADFARDHSESCWNTLMYLKESKYPKVRWQVFEVLGYAGAQGEIILRESLLNDDDSYCRRRALLSLARIQPSDIKQIAKRYISDNDQYMRQVANDILND